MSTATAQRSPRNGVDVPTLFATLDVVRGAPEAAKFQFRATNRWVSGTHSQTTISGFYGAGEEREHKTTFVHNADHPEVLVGEDRGTVPVEYLLVAVSTCTRCHPPSRATSISTGSSVSTPRPAMAISRSASISRSRVTPPTRYCARSWNSRGSAPRSTT
jgi:hypothetical protein